MRSGSSFDLAGSVHRSGLPIEWLNLRPFHAVGVGSNGEDPVTEVRGADGCCRYAIPDRVVPERGQVPENFSPDGSVVDSKDVRHVLHEDVAGSKLANGSGHLAPQNGLGVVEPVAESGGAGSLAGEPAGEEINGPAPSADCSNVVVSNSARESLGEDSLTSPLIGLADPRWLVEASEHEAEVEHSRSGEDASMPHRTTILSLRESGWPVMADARIPGRGVP